jgi:hypothetical protein
VGTKVRSKTLVAVLAALCALAPALVVAAPAQAGIGTPVLADCNANVRLTHTYTVTELRNALATMPETMREYTDCPQVIQAALAVALGHRQGNGTGTSSSGGSFLPTPVIVVLVLLALAACTFGVLALRRRRAV